MFRLRQLLPKIEIFREKPWNFVYVFGRRSQSAHFQRTGDGFCIPLNAAFVFRPPDGNRRLEQAHKSNVNFCFSTVANKLCVVVVMIRNFIRVGQIHKGERLQ